MKNGRLLTVESCNLEINLLCARVHWRGTEVKLTRQSYAILALFASDPYRKFTKDEVISHAGITASGFHGQIKRLRQIFRQTLIITHGRKLYSLLERKQNHVQK